MVTDPDQLVYDRLVYLYDPHEDGMGCPHAKPRSLTKLLNSLAGHVMPLFDAVAEIKEACPNPDGEVVPYGESLAKYGGFGGTKFGYISVKFNQANGGSDSYCAIKFNDVELGPAILD